MTRVLPRILLITDRRRTPGNLTAAIRAALMSMPTGAAGIILREKDLDDSALLALAREVREVTAERGALLIVNGRVAIAAGCGANGVQLGHDASSISEARQALPQALVGVSLHGDDVVPDEADFALYSPIFATSSKPEAKPVGLGGLKETVSRSPIAIFALGGVTASNAASCREAGAYGVAVLGDVLLRPDPGAAARTLWHVVELGWRAVEVG